MSESYLVGMDIRGLIKSMLHESAESKDYKWIYFQLVKDSGKTKTYAVFAKEGNAALGTVKWYSSWRKYAFFPEGGSLFEKDCLNDIASFLDELMLSRK